MLLVDTLTVLYPIPFIVTLVKRSPTFPAPGTGFVEDRGGRGGGGGQQQEAELQGASLSAGFLTGGPGLGTAALECIVSTSKQQQQKKLCCNTSCPVMPAAASMSLFTLSLH